MFEIPTIFNVPSPVSKLQEVMYDVAPLELPIWFVVKGVSSVRWLWKFNQKRKIYENSDNWVGLLGGSALNNAVESEWLRTAAHLLLVTIKIKEHIEEVNIFKKEVRSLKRAIDGFYLTTGGHKWWVPKGRNLFTSPSSEIQRTYNRHMFFERVNRIAICSKRVLYRLFNLTMHTLEVYDALFRKEDTLNEAMRECFVNSAILMRALSQNEKEVMRGIEGIVKPILKKWDSEADPAAILSRMKVILKGVKVTVNAYDSFTQSFGGVLKRAAAEYATVGLGFGYFVPDSWRGPIRCPTEMEVESQV